MEKFEEGQSGEEVASHLSAPYVPPSAQQQRFAEQERRRKAIQAEDRRKRLVAMRDRQALEGEQEQEGSGMRLKHLMEQADLLSSLTTGVATPGTTGAASSKATKQQGRRRAGRLSEKEEDEQLLKMSDSTVDGGGSSERQTRLTVQPSCITGKMRPYQVISLR